MSQRKRIAAYLLTFATAAMLMAARVQSGDAQPPPVPYGTQETLKLRALVDAAPFMTRSEDRVVTLKQERLRACADALAYQFEAFAVGRDQSFAALMEPLAQVKTSWLALSTADAQRMPMLEYILQIAEQREKASQARFDQGRLTAIENLAAKRDRLTAEIEMIECQRAMANAGVR